MIRIGPDEINWITWDSGTGILGNCLPILSRAEGQSDEKHRKFRHQGYPRRDQDRQPELIVAGFEKADKQQKENEAENWSKPS
jgi:hypothetical protein